MVMVLQERDRPMECRASFLIMTYRTLSAICRCPGDAQAEDLDLNKISTPLGTYGDLSYSEVVKHHPQV